MIEITSGVKLIGLYGKARSGKDTVASFLTDTYKNHYQIAFADPLKVAASEAFGIPLDHFHQGEIKELTNPLWEVSPRQIAQFFGTEMFRETISKLIPNIGSDFWIKRLAIRLNNEYVPEDQGEYDSNDTMVISDVRFQNEYDWIIENGGSIIHLTRDGADGNIGIPNHASEQTINLHNKERTYVCDNNGTIADLHRNVANILIATKY